jgi:hypothetical protein
MDDLDFPIGYFEQKSRKRQTPGARFWILWNPLSNLPPRVRFGTRAEAERIAAECAVKYNGRVYVCEAKMFFEPLSVPVSQTVLD